MPPAKRQFFDPDGNVIPVVEADEKEITEAADDLNQLTLQERNQAYEDVHGVAKPIEETPELLEISVASMKSCLQESEYPNKGGYDKALQMNAAYVHSPKILLVWLRCDRFDPKKAAHRYVNYWEMVECTFGAAALGRDITQADLGPAEMKHLRKGHIQFLLQRDSAGRAIQFLDPICLMKMYSGPVEEELSAQKACFYLVMRTIFDSIETQRHGVVSIVYGVDTRLKTLPQKEFKLPKPRFMSSVAGGFHAVPMRVTCFHFLSCDLRLRPFLSLYRHALGRGIRARFQCHFGSARDGHDRLQTFGIPVAAIPITEAGVISYTKHAKTLKRYQLREEDLRKGQPLNLDWNQAVFLPNPNDILLGRGRPYQDHAGNVRLRDIIDQHYEEYDTASRGTKTAIAEQVVSVVQETYGGRFLKLDEPTHWWFPVTPKEANAKVCQGFRKKREMDKEALGDTAAFFKKDDSSGKRTKIQLQQEQQPGGTMDQPRQQEEQTTTPEMTDLPDTDFAHSLATIDLQPLQSAPDKCADILTEEEFDFLMDGLAKTNNHIPLSRLVSDPASDDTETASCSNTTCTTDPSESTATTFTGKGDAEDPFESLLARIVDPSLHVVGKESVENAVPIPLTVPATAPDDDNPAAGDDPLKSFLETHQDCLKCSPEESLKWLNGQDILTLADLADACRDEEFVDLDLVPKGGLKGFKRRPFIRAIANLVAE